jgi:hypothetical protein
VGRRVIGCVLGGEELIFDLVCVFGGSSERGHECEREGERE